MGVKKKLVKTILDADNAKRLKRAADQGFDTDKVLYHGRGNNLDQLLPTPHDETGIPGISFSTDPKVASRYAAPDERLYRGETGVFTPNVVPVYLKGKTAPYMEFFNDAIQELGEDAVFNSDDALLDYAKARGVTALDYSDILGDGEVSVLDPANIRSVNAKFDPENIGKNDIMGSVDPKILAALGVAGAGAALASPDAEAGVKKKIADTILDPDNAKQALKKRQAYHGTPHDFDAFDLKKIGTGEGAQAYGHGLYFSGKKEIAEYYRDALSEGWTANYKGAPIPQSVINDLPFEEQAVFRMFKSNLNSDTANIGKKAMLEEIKIDLKRDFPDMGNWDEIVDRIAPDLDFKGQGKLYEVEIPDESHMLDWDLPLSEQPEGVRKALEQADPELFSKMVRDEEFNPQFPENFTGKIFYDRMAGATGGGVGPNQAEASAKLKELGIPGITYKGATSDERNFVVFDDALVDIKEKGFIDPKVLAALGLGSGAAAAIKPGAGNYAAATLQGIGHMPKMMWDEAWRAGGYMNSLIGAEDPDKVDEKASKISNFLWDTLAAGGGDAYKNKNILNPKTEAAKANILQGAGGFANQFIEEVGSSREGQAIKSAYNTLVPIYRKLPKSIRGLLESM